MKTTQQSKVLFMAQAAMIAAIYVVLTMLGASFAFGEVQIRFSEALTILPAITPGGNSRSIFRMSYQQHIRRSNLAGYYFRSIATLIGALFTWQLRNKSKYLAPVPPIIANALIVPFILKYGYAVPLPIPFMMLTVGLGEVISCGVLGMILYTALNKYKGVLFKPSIS